MDKTTAKLAEAVANIADNAVVMIGGFGGSGAPIELIHALADRYQETGSPKNLTIINNNAGNGKIGIAALLKLGMVSKVICSFPRTVDSHAFTERYMSGDVELELVPQGTLAERIRAAGAGIPAFFTPTSFGTDLALGKQVQEFDGKGCVLERWLKADVALVKAEVGDRMGNLTYRLAARNFNPLMCMAAATTIAQVTSIVEPGELQATEVVTPGIYVDIIVEVSNPDQEESLIRAGVEYS